MALVGVSMCPTTQGARLTTTVHDEERVNKFLRTLEPGLLTLSQQSEQYGRLSPVPDLDSDILETPAPLASPARLQLEGELETYVLRKHNGAELEVAVKGESAI